MVLTMTPLMSYSCQYFSPNKDAYFSLYVVPQFMTLSNKCLLLFSAKKDYKLKLLRVTLL